MPRASRSASPRAGRGFSVVEIVIALAILFTLVTFLLVALKGRENEGRTSSRYLNAVMLAQKIADDLEHRTRENPHAVERLAAASPEGSPRAGGGELFRFLEDTTADGMLGNDAGIDESAGSLHTQFAAYRYRVDFDRSVGNGLARARIRIFWDDRGRARSYELSALLPDLPARIDSGAPADYDESLSGAEAGLALFGEAGDFADACARHRIDEALALEFAKVRRVVSAVSARLAEAEQADREIANSARAATAGGVARRAALREENGILILRAHRALARPLAELDARATAGTLDTGDLFRGSVAVNLLRDLTLLARAVDGRPNRDCLAIRFNVELSEALAHQLRLVADPAIAGTLPWRERTGALTRLIELGSVLVQANAGRLVFTIGDGRITLQQLVENAFGVLAGLLAGRDYNKADYVNEKLKAIRHRRFAEYEDVSERVALLAAVSEAAARLLDSGAPR